MNREELKEKIGEELGKLNSELIGFFVCQNKVMLLIDKYVEDREKKPDLSIEQFQRDWIEITLKSYQSNLDFLMMRRGWQMEDIISEFERFQFVLPRCDRRKRPVV